MLSHITLELVRPLLTGLLSNTAYIILVSPSSWHLAQDQAQSVQFQPTKLNRQADRLQIVDDGKDGTKVESQ